MARRRKKKDPQEIDPRLIKACHALVVIEQSTRAIVQKGIDVHNELHIALWDNMKEAQEALAFIKEHSHGKEDLL